MSTTYYLETTVPMPADVVARRPQETEGSREGAEHVLSVSVYYARDTRKRGLKLSLTCESRAANSRMSWPMAPYNATLHLADMGRKNDKIGAAWGERVNASLDGIAKIAFESERPDFQQVFALFENAAA